LNLKDTLLHSRIMQTRNKLKAMSLRSQWSPLISHHHKVPSSHGKTASGTCANQPISVWDPFCTLSRKLTSINANHKPHNRLQGILLSLLRFRQDPGPHERPISRQL